MNSLKAEFTVFKIKHGRAPNYLTSNFNALHQCHSHLTLGSSNHNYILSKYMANCSTSFAFTAIKSWNGLPVSLKELGSEHVFKSRLKEYLISTYWMIPYVTEWTFTGIWLCFMDFTLVLTDWYQSHSYCLFDVDLIGNKSSVPLVWLLWAIHRSLLFHAMYRNKSNLI